MAVFCVHMLKLLRFLNEVNGHGWLPVKSQTIYNCYEKKRAFMEKMEEMEEMQLIKTQRNNGHIKSIKLDISGEILMHYMNLLLKDRHGH